MIADNYIEALVREGQALGVATYEEDVFGRRANVPVHVDTDAGSTGRRQSLQDDPERATDIEYPDACLLERALIREHRANHRGFACAVLFVGERRRLVEGFEVFTGFVLELTH